MPVNQTLDDTTPSFVYGGEWRNQPSGDALAAGYYSQTYHVSQTDNSTLLLTFNGTACYIYGSTGPGHGTFTVRWLNTIEPLSAYAPTFQTQQLLFGKVFATDGSEGGGPDGSGSHQVLLTTVTNGTNNWFDVDFVTLTFAGSAATTFGSYSSTNAAVLSSFATQTLSPNTPSPSNTTVPLTIPSRSSHISGSTIAAIILGVALFLTIIIAFGLRYMHRSTNKVHEKGRNVRYVPGRSFTSSGIPIIDPLQSPAERTFSPTSSNPLTTSFGGVAPINVPLDVEHPHQLRDVHNSSAMGWSNRTAVDGSVIGRSTTPNSIAKNLNFAAAGGQQQQVPSGAMSTKPPSYNSPYTQGLPPLIPPPLANPPSRPPAVERISEVANSTEALASSGRGSPYSEPRPVPPVIPPESGSPRSTAFRINKKKPRKDRGQGRPSPEMYLYDDGDSRRSNFLQV